jgi:hypothetical protein
MLGITLNSDHNKPFNLDDYQAIEKTLQFCSHGEYSNKSLNEVQWKYSQNNKENKET